VSCKNSEDSRVCEGKEEEGSGTRAHGCVNGGRVMPTAVLRRLWRRHKVVFLLGILLPLYLMKAKHRDDDAVALSVPPPWRTESPAVNRSRRDVVVLNQFERDRRLLAAARAKDAEKHRVPKHANLRPNTAPSEARHFTQAPQYAGREEALLRANQTAEDIKNEKAQGYAKNAFNQFVSDRISLHRDLNDPRSAWCKEQKYDVSTLPTASLVIVFHNEARSTLLRTIWSALDKSPHQLLREIILVDDGSTMDHLKKPLQDEIDTIPRTKLLRLKHRSGLIRARVEGAKLATSDVLIVLDSHCECNHGWLEPLLHRIHENRTNVVTPVIDGLDQHTWKYLGGPDTTTRGVFSWSLVFTWLDLPYDVARNRDNPSAPLASPTMAGGLFAMDLQYFWDLGAYDLGMDVWGGENLEISFRIWMCGGRLEIIQCSRVGHVFRDHHPYKFPDGFRVIKKNANRVAEVWLDEFKSIYYEAEPGARNVEAGDISDRVELRNRLKCRSFKWYLKNVFPDMFVPIRENVIAAGSLRNRGTGLCVYGTTKVPFMNQCNANTEANAQNRFYFVKRNNEIRFENSQGPKCLDSSKSDPLSFVEMWGCHGLKGNQEWHYVDGHRIKHAIGGTCLEVHTDSKGSHLVVNHCTTGQDPKQAWDFNKWSYTDAT